MTQLQTAKKLYDKPKVGADVLSYCGSCKMELAHVIMAMIDTLPAKVQCKTCRAEHKWRRTTGLKTTAGKTRKKATPKKVIRASELWEEKLAEKNTSNLVNYSPKSSFEKGNVIKHVTFGLGIIEEVRINKIVVFFRVGEKILIHQVP